MNKITLPISILLSSVILVAGLLGVQYSKQRSIERQQLIELQAKEDVEQAKTEQAEENAQKQKTNTVAVNACIASAQAQRDYRKGNLDQNLMDYLKDHSYQPDETYEYMQGITAEAKTKIDRKYNEWVDECKRGVKPDLTDFVY